MERLYNPDLMSEREISETFVGRHALVDELVSLVEHQPDGAGVQHAVVVAPRGMGKTTILLMLQFAIGSRGLSSRWQVVRFPEECYGISDLADLWLEVTGHLARDTDDVSLRDQAARLKADYASGKHLQEAAWALLKDWCRQQQRRVLLLVDNLDLILEQIGDEQENACLRDVLMNDGTIVLIGGATSFFREVRAYEQPLYNFFRIYHLEDLGFDDIVDLLRRRAIADGRADFGEVLEANTNRLHVLQHFTGGNPRLVLMLYRVITESDVVEVHRALENLLDQVTPYYKARIESLPAQQRKVLDSLARLSAQTNEGQTPTALAAQTRLGRNVVTTQLRRLAELGYVRTANLRGRSTYYTLSEPLYAIWHQMRFGGAGRERMRWLVDFLQDWYGEEELGAQAARMADRTRDRAERGALHQAIQSLEHRRYLAEAVERRRPGTGALVDVVRDGAEMLEQLRDVGAPRLDPSNGQALVLQARLLLQMGRHQEVLTASEPALAALEGGSSSRGEYTAILFYRLLALAALAEYGLIEREWDRAITLSADSSEWQRPARAVLLTLARRGEFALVRRLAARSGCEDAFTPLIRAIEYIETGNEGPLEKLSPEVRSLAEAMVEVLRARTGAP